MEAVVMKEHVLDPKTFHYFWSKDHKPALEIEAGDIVHCETDEVTGSQLQPGMPADTLGKLDFDKLYPLAGPIYVRGAEPGDTLEIEVLHLKALRWGWTGIIPGLGLLDQDFATPYIKYFDLSSGSTTHFRDDIHIPIQPFLGTMGVATDEEGKFPVLPPTKGGGNIDTRHIGVGSKLHLPVYLKGGMFSAGDGHAAQGDGEVCVTAIECPMEFSLRFNVINKKMRPFSYQFSTPPGSLQPRYDAAGYHVTSALGPDLMTNAQNAVRDMIDWLVEHKNLSREDAYLLCSLAGDLKISQIVDRPNFGVSFYLALGVFK
jgi:acetamidase/formamidase